jgi:hypothetical protein
VPKSIESANGWFASIVCLFLGRMLNIVPVFACDRKLISLRFQ